MHGIWALFLVGTQFQVQVPMFGTEFPVPFIFKTENFEKKENFGPA
jgi:hypothetical protein